MKESVVLMNITKEDWQSLAHLMLSLNTGLDGRKETKKLRKRIGIVREILRLFMNNMDNSEHVELSFLVGSIKTIEKLENDYETYDIKNKEFIIFLKFFLSKLEKQKIVAKKPMERRIELNKLKGAVENATYL